LAKQGDGALSAGRLLEARDLFGKARRQLPALPSDLPAHVSRVFGETRLRHSYWVMSVAYSPDGTKLVSGSQDGTARVWDTATGQLAHELAGHSLMIQGVAWSPDGKWLASIAGDRSLRLWYAADGKVLSSAQPHTGNLFAVAFHPDSRTVAVGGGGQDNTVRL